MADQKKKERKTPGPYRPGKQCPKCNSRMAEHSDRNSCGRCGYTEFKPKK